MSDVPSRHPSDRTLADYRLGTLDAMLRESVEAHLVACEECRRRAASAGGLGRGSKTSDGFASSLADQGSASPTPSPDSMPRELADHPDYHVIRELGRGGMGVVYLAENRLMGRKEVLKVVGSHLVKKKTVLERFLREIRAAAQLHHPNIVAALTASRMGETIVFAMEYVDGYDLAKLVERKGRLDVPLACNFIHQAALGLQHAHERGMVHRDVKPSNLMVTREGKRPVLKILDFGLAKVTSEAGVDAGLTHEGQLLGTPHYVAPEQTTDAQKADIRADIYSLGCTLYCLLSGRPPFDAGSLYELLQAHHSKEPESLVALRPDVPPELVAVLAKMMAKTPQDRYQQPVEVAAALVPFFRAGAKAQTSRAVGPVAAPAFRRPEAPAPAPDPVEFEEVRERSRGVAVAGAVAASLALVAAPVVWLATRPTEAPATSSIELPRPADPGATPSPPPTPVALGPKVEDERGDSRIRGFGAIAIKRPAGPPVRAPLAPGIGESIARAADLLRSEANALGAKPIPLPLPAATDPAVDAFTRSPVDLPQPVPTESDDGPVAWADLLQNLSRYHGKEVQVREVLAYTQTPFVDSPKAPGGIGARLMIKNVSSISSGDGRIAGSTARLMVDPGLARHVRELTAMANAKPSPDDPFEVVARFRVDAPEQLLTLVGMEVLFAYNRPAIANDQLGEAFKIMVVDGQTATVGNGDGPKWLERLGGSRFAGLIKSQVRGHLKNRAADQRWAESNVFFSQVAAQSARWAEQNQREQDEIRRRMMNMR